jgi:hypothetical protein
LPKQYPDFRSFYTAVQSKDQETIVLKRETATVVGEAMK